MTAGIADYQKDPDFCVESAACKILSMETTRFIKESSQSILGASTYLSDNATTQILNDIEGLGWWESSEDLNKLYVGLVSLRYAVENRSTDNAWLQFLDSEIKEKLNISEIIKNMLPKKESELSIPSLPFSSSDVGDPKLKNDINEKLITMSHKASKDALDILKNDEDIKYPKKIHDVFEWVHPTLKESTEIFEHLFLLFDLG